MTPRAVPRPRAGRDGGSASLLAVAVLAVVAAVALGAAAAAGEVVLADGRAQDAADAAALAAARAVDDLAPPLRAATAAAAPYGARVLRCRCGTTPVAVTVEVPVVAPPARSLGLTARRATARAALAGP